MQFYWRFCDLIEIGNISERQKAKIGKQTADMHNSYLTFTYEQIY